MKLFEAAGCRPKPTCQHAWDKEGDASVPNTCTCAKPLYRVLLPGPEDHMSSQQRMCIPYQSLPQDTVWVQGYTHSMVGTTSTRIKEAKRSYITWAVQCAWRDEILTGCLLDTLGSKYLCGSVLAVSSGPGKDQHPFGKCKDWTQIVPPASTDGNSCQEITVIIFSRRLAVALQAPSFAYPSSLIS